MKQINRIIIGLILLLFNINFAQELNGFKYCSINDIVYEGRIVANNTDSKGMIADHLRTYGIIPIEKSDIYPQELKENSCLLVSVTNFFYRGGSGIIPAYFSKLIFSDCTGANSLTIELRHQNSYRGALNKTLSKLKKDDYFFNPELTPKIVYPEVENINKTEVELKADFDSKQIDPIEGIYKTYKSEINYKVGIFKVGEQYKAIIIESDISHWKKGDVKAIFESTAAQGVFSIKFYNENKILIETFANLEGGLITVELKNSEGEDANIKLLKLYPIK